METLQTTLDSIKTNKDMEEKKVNNFYDSLIKFLEDKKAEQLDNIRTIFSSNAERLNEKLDFFSTRMEEVEDIKANVYAILEKSPEVMADLLTRFNQIVEEVTDPNILNLDIAEYKFAHEDENKISKYLSNSGDLRSGNKIIRFNSNNQNNSKANFNNNNKYNLLNNYQDEYLETSVIIDSDARAPKQSSALENSVNRTRDIKITDKYQFNQPSFSSTAGQFGRSIKILI
jgi:hypothetical protein